MKNTISVISFLTIFIFHFSALSQEKQLEKAEENYEVYAFAKAIDIYEKVAEKGYGSADLYKKLGNSYYFNADLKNAGKWYEKLFETNEDIEPEFYFRYSHALKAIGDYKKADKMMDGFEKLSADGRGALYNKTSNYLDLIKLQSGRYEIKNLAFNSPYSDFAPSFYKAKLIFSSARDTGVYAKRKHGWDNEYFLDLYTGKIGINGRITEVESFSSELNTKLHESTSAFTKNGTTVYFTRNNYENGSRGKDEQGITKLKIFKAILNANGKWSDIVELPFNSNQYSVAHPALNAEETKLYFASDMPGTKGMSDIFVVDINSDGTYGEPVNMGDKVNTEGRETFPFISLNNDLYFASDGRPGLGGLDIYVTKLDENGSVGNIYNVGEPVNSSDDDFTFIIDDNTGMGYFASNRAGGMGNDDIYYIEQIAPVVSRCKKPVKGMVVDKSTGAPLDGAHVSYINAENKVSNSVITNENGLYSFTVFCDEPGFIRASKKDYLTNEVKIDTALVSINIELENAVVTAKTGDDLAHVLDLRPIYFDLDKSNIRRDAKAELEKVVAALNKYPNLKIDIRSHTDSRAGDDYNLQLSEKRTQSTIDYLVKQGIDRSRLSGKGYGETQLLNHCSNGIDCTQEEHQLNRRSEFIIQD